MSTTPESLATGTSRRTSTSQANFSNPAPSTLTSSSKSPTSASPSAGSVTSSLSPDSQLQEPAQVSSEAKSPENEDNASINKDDLRQKLQKIPIETLKEILMNQVDLEIRLKHKELKLTEEEIGKCESQMIILRKFFEVPNQIKINDEPSDFTVKYFNLLNQSLSVNYTKLQKQQYQQQQQQSTHHLQQQQSSQPYPYHHQHSHSVPDYVSPGSEDMLDDANNYHFQPVHSYRTRSTTSSLRPSHAAMAAAGMSVGPYDNSNQASRLSRTVGCLYRRTDGVIVKLTCPDCQRSNFSSAQGFLNHSRIAHSKEYTSQDAAALKCGDILPEHEQDEEGLASIKSLKEKGIDANRNLNVNEIYFNGLSNSLNTVHRTSVSKIDDKSSASEGSGVVDNGEAITLALPPLTQSQQSQNPDKLGSSALMKKLIKNGITSNQQEYESFIEEVRDESKYSHIFDDDEEEENATVATAAPSTKPSNEGAGRLKRRKSRGVMGISRNVNVAHKQVSNKANEAATPKESDGVDDVNIIAHSGGPTSGTRSKSGTKIHTLSDDEIKEVILVGDGEGSEPETKRRRSHR